MFKEFETDSWRPAASEEKGSLTNIFKISSSPPIFIIIICGPEIRNTLMIEKDKNSLSANPKDQSSLSDDQRVRSSIRSKEYKQIKDMNKDLDEEEEELKRFFNEGSAIGQSKSEADPTLVSSGDSRRETKGEGPNQKLQGDREHSEREKVHD